ncbi:hypothetical protein CEXT_695141 [Caerostris extrusa]|uniref:Uncharacterized protein n=1 Tax=Caerostris extrusa TaxID=172846 RepID=A0AAV4X321_CAEEX|nr:hypothetical protein CEXT_695141 [Caerostris extrusa]
MEGIAYIGGNGHRDGTVSAFGGHNTDNSFSTGGSSLNESRSSLGHSSTARATSSGGPSHLDGEADLMTPATNPLFEDPEHEEDFRGSSKDDSSEGEVALVETHEPRTDQNTRQKTRQNCESVTLQMAYYLLNKNKLQNWERPSTSPARYKVAGTVTMDLTLSYCSCLKSECVKVVFHHGTFYRLESVFSRSDTC